MTDHVQRAATVVFLHIFQGGYALLVLAYPGLWLGRCGRLRAKLEILQQDA
jgi:hypothetical protein